MEYFAGIFIALTVLIFLSMAGMDRDRSLYPVILIATTSYYALFAVMAGSVGALGFETLVFMVFAAMALIGFKNNLWLVAAALAGHGVFDLFHSHLIANPGMPSWWPMFCMSFDIVAALYLGWRLTSSHAIRPAGAKVGEHA